MKFTLIGGHGVIGSSLLQMLRADNHECVAIGRSEADRPGVNLGHVIYAAGVTADFRARPYDTVNAHVSRVARLLESSKFDSFLYLSSTRVYRLSDHGAEERPVITDPGDPESLYDISKLMGEALCLGHAMGTVRVARLSNVVDDDAARPDFLSTVVRDALTRGEVVFQSTLDSERDFIAKHDLAPILIRITVSGEKRIYNVASGTNLSNRAIGELLQSTTGCTVREQAKAQRVKYPRIDTSRITQEFQFKPTPAPAMVQTAIARAMEHANSH